MSESGTTNFPLNIRSDTLLNAQASEKALLGARLIGLPHTIEQSPTPLKIRGEITQVLKDGRVHIETQKGDVTVQVNKDSAASIKEGTRVELDIPAQRIPKDSVTNTPEQSPKKNISRQDVHIKIQRATSRPTQTDIQTSTPEPSTRARHTPIEVELNTSIKQEKPTQNSSKENPLNSFPARIDALPQNIQIFPIDAPAHKQKTIIQPHLTKISALTIPSETAQPQKNTTLITQIIPNQIKATLPSIVDVFETSNPFAIPQKTEHHSENFTLQTLSAVHSFAHAHKTESAIQPITPNAQTLPEIQTSAKIEISANPLLSPPIKPQSVTPNFVRLSAAPQEISTITFAKADTSPVLNVQQAQPVFSIQNTGSNIALFEPSKELPQNSKLQNISSATAITHNIEASKPSLIGRIIGQTSEGLPAVQISWPTLFEGQAFILHQPSSHFTQGSTITLQPQSGGETGTGAGSTNTIATLASSLPAPLSASWFLTPQNWPVLDSIHQTLLSQNASAASQNVSGLPLIPNATTPSQIAPAALFFMAALKAGDLSNLLSEKSLDILKSNNKGQSLLSRLSQESGALSRIAGDAPSAEWRGIPIPMAHDHHIDKIALHYRQESEEDSAESKKGTRTRFIFDLNLDRMGKVQLDGLLEPKHLDLTLKTTEIPSKAMQHAMSTAYISALEESGFSGKLSFRHKAEDWVTINAQDHENFVQKV